MSETHSNFIVVIILSDGTTMESKQYAVSKWHALDKAHSMNYHLQSDRTKYDVK